MKINFFTFQKNSATAIGYKNVLSEYDNMTFQSNDFVNFDVNLFTGFKKEVDFLINKEKEINKKTLIGIVDPKNINILKKLRNFDFIVVDSIEMEIYFRKLQKPIFRLVEFPSIKKIDLKKSRPCFKEKIKIGYHGNRQHILSMYPNICSALCALGKEKDVELLLIYNYKNVYKVPNIFPENIKVKHIQWTEDAYKELQQCNFGLVPNLMPISQNAHAKISKSKFFLENNYDYITRYKMLSNPGRALLFMFMGIPVISDLNPSSIELIEHNKDGFIAYNADSYYYAMKQLCDYSKNIDCRKNIKKKIIKYKPAFQMKNFISNLKDLEQNKIKLIPISHFSKYSYQNLNFKFVFWMELTYKFVRKIRSIF